METLRIAGLPLAAWLLLVASFGLGLAVELAFYWRQRSRSSARSERER